MFDVWFLVVLGTPSATGSNTPLRMVLPRVSPSTKTSFSTRQAHNNSTSVVEQVGDPISGPENFNSAWCLYIWILHAMESMAQISPEAERSRSAGVTVELGTELLFPTLIDGMRVETHFPVRPSISVEVWRCPDGWCCRRNPSSLMRNSVLVIYCTISG